MRKFYFIGVLLVAAATCNVDSFAQLPAQSPVQQRLLPERFGAWSKGQCDSAAPASPLSAEAGQRFAESCQFSFHGGSVNVSAASFRDPSRAYEVYTSEIRPGMTPSTVGRHSAINAEVLLVLVGNALLRVEKPREVSTGDLQQLAQAVQERSADAPLPPIRAYLPEEGLVAGTQRYALGAVGMRKALEELHVSGYAGMADAAGFSSGAEAMLAEYRGRKASAVLVLLEYPTPQLAELHRHHLETVVSSAPKQGEATIERKGSLLSMVLTPSSAEYAEGLRRAINYEMQVTWNEPSHVLTDPPWTSVIAKIFIGTGVFMLIAVVLGIAFGGVRIVTKKLLPGKVFDRPESMEVLQLGLSGKKIDPRDFY